MKLSELLKPLRESSAEPETTCQYLDSIGIKYVKTKNATGAKFDLVDSTPKETKNLVDDILSVSEISSNFDVGYAGGTTIVVEFK